MDALDEKFIIKGRQGRANTEMGMSILDTRANLYERSLRVRPEIPLVQVNLWTDRSMTILSFYICSFFRNARLRGS